MRADYFFGNGQQAASQARRMKERGQLWLLLPRGMQVAGVDAALSGRTRSGASGSAPRRRSASSPWTGCVWMTMGGERLPRVVVLGSFVHAHWWSVPRLPGAGESCLAHAVHSELGGKGLNVAVGIQRLGVEVDLVLGVGRDACCPGAGVAAGA